jgi:hypothetical protein
MLLLKNALIVFPSLAEEDIGHIFSCPPLLCYPNRIRIKFRLIVINNKKDLLGRRIEMHSSPIWTISLLVSAPWD